MVQLYVNEGSSGQDQTYYTGVMSWYGGTDTNDDNSREVMLHAAGLDPRSSGAEGARNWSMRTLATTDNGSSGPDDLKLQLRATYAPSGTSHELKLRRML